MRPVLPGDVVQAALVLLAAPVAARPTLIRQMIHEADQADAHRLKTGQAHPLWGTGSLMFAAMARKRAPEPYWDDPDYAGCLITVLHALIAHQTPPAA